jgi:hypothetical protein
LIKQATLINKVGFFGVEELSNDARVKASETISRRFANRLKVIDSTDHDLLNGSTSRLYQITNFIKLFNYNN